MTAAGLRHLRATGLCGLNESRESFWKSAHGEATVPAQRPEYAPARGASQAWVRLPGWSRRFQVDPQFRDRIGKHRGGQALLQETDELVLPRLPEHHAVQGQGASELNQTTGVAAER